MSDLISREALITTILKDRKLDGVNANWEVNRILVHIKNAPTVKPKQGEWIIKGLTEPYGKCNQCGEICEVDNFCGNCGADMRKGGAE